MIVIYSSVAEVLIISSDVAFIFYGMQAKKRKLGLPESDDDVSGEKEETPAVAKIQGNLNLIWFYSDYLYIRTYFNPYFFSDHSERSFYKELVKVIEASDVILEVLDARDPLGTRCVDMEKMVLKVDPSKRIVLLLNKIGMQYLKLTCAN